METNRTIKIWTRTYHGLRILAALTGETMSAAMERLVMRERERVEHEQRRKGTIPMDQHAQFRSAVRDVLAILLDKTADPEDRVSRATTILLSLPVPVPQIGVPSVVAPEHHAPLYLAGPDGLPTAEVYVPDDDEGPLTDEEVTIMLREMREG